MPGINYSLGGIEFDAVPEILDSESDSSIRSDITLARSVIVTTGVNRERIILKGKFMSVEKRNQFLQIQKVSSETGVSIEFFDGYQTRNVLIDKFISTPIVGRVEGYSFQMEFLIVR